MRKTFVIALFCFIATQGFAETSPADGDRSPSREPAEDRPVSLGSKRAIKTAYFGFGPALMSNANVSGVGVYFSAAYAFEVDAIVIRIRGDVGGRRGAILGDIGLGATYFLIDAEKAPFIGLDFGYGVARIKTAPEETVHGFVLAALTGVQFLRSASINLELALRLAVMLEPSSIGHPVMGGLRMGLYF